MAYLTSASKSLGIHIIKDAERTSLEGLACDVGFGTFAAISLYQGWMKCTFEAHGNPLPGLKHDESSAECGLGELMKE